MFWQLLNCSQSTVMHTAEFGQYVTFNCGVVRYHFIMLVVEWTDVSAMEEHLVSQNHNPDCQCLHTKIFGNSRLHLSKPICCSSNLYQRTSKNHGPKYRGIHSRRSSARWLGFCRGFSWKAKIPQIISPIIIKYGYWRYGRMKKHWNRCLLIRL